MTLPMSRIPVALAAIALVAGACSVQQGDPSATNDPPSGGDPQANKTVDVGGTGAADVAGTGAADTSGNTDPGRVDQPCTSDGTCASGICYRGLCSPKCTGTADCLGGEDCSTDDGKRLLCVVPAYDPNVGSSCAATGFCKGDLKCSAAKEVASAFCTDLCEDNTDCPMRMACNRKVGGKTYCGQRKFCGECLHNDNCLEGGACLKMSSGTFCTTPCTANSTECPRFASCGDIGGGNYQCVHKFGSCSSFGEQCEPCTVDAQCNENSSCMSFYFSKEQFCSNDCTNSSCPQGYNCIQTSQTGKSCIPGYKLPAMPTCVNNLSPMMEKGDIMDDFAMVGVTDTDGDGDLIKEELRLFHFSDFAANHKLIYFNVSAGWCAYCQLETKEFPMMDYEYAPQGVVIFQALFDGYKKGQWTFPSEAVLRSWLKALKPLGVIGVDPERNSVPYNTGGGTPLNMIIDAKTRKVLEKWSGYGKGKAEYLLKLHLANMQ